MLTGELIRFRVLERSDVETVWRWDNDPEVMRWLSDGYPESFDQCVARFERRSVNSYERVGFGIETLDEGRLVGFVALRDVEPDMGSAELDIYIGERDCWGRGYATDAMRLICRYGFDKMRLHRIGLDVVAENVAARRVYEKVGFVEEGRTRESFYQDGTWYDTIIMGLLRGELIDRDSSQVIERRSS